MKKMKSFNNKLTSAFLAFVVLLVGVFSFGTIKQETASADIIAEARPFTAELIEDFGYRLVNELNLPSTPHYSCLLVDSDLLIDGSENFVTASTLSDLEGLPFFVGLANGLIDYYNLDSYARTTSTLTIAQTLNACDLEIVVFHRGSQNSMCTNLTTGAVKTNITTVSRFFNQFNYNLNDPAFQVYAAGVWSITNHLETLLSRFQTYSNYTSYASPFYVYPREDVHDGGTLMVSVCLETCFYPEY